MKRKPQASNDINCKLSEKFNGTNKLYRLCMEISLIRSKLTQVLVCNCKYQYFNMSYVSHFFRPNATDLQLAKYVIILDQILIND